MAVVWPGTLPQSPLIEGYREAPQDQTIRSQMDAGPDKIRRRFTAAINTFQVSFNMTSEQVETFEEFFNDTINGGAEEFEFTHPRKGSTLNFRFVGTYSIGTIRGDYFRVSAVFEVLP